MRDLVLSPALPSLQEALAGPPAHGLSGHPDMVESLPCPPPSVKVRIQRGD